MKPVKTWVGNASWYGPGFHGRKTAMAKRFDSEALTAAHPTCLLFHGSRGEHSNGKFELDASMTGVLIRRRENDVSYRVAPKIGLIHSGVSQVRLELIGATREALTRRVGSTMTLTSTLIRSSLIVALDFDSLTSAVKFAKQVADLVGMFKIGNSCSGRGSAAVKELPRWARVFSRPKIPRHTHTVLAPCFPRRP